MATNLQFIKSASGTSVSSLSVTDCFSAEYDVYYISITKIDQSATGTGIVYRFLDSSNTAITSSSYDQATLVMKSNTTFSESRGTNGTYGFGAVGYGIRDAEDGVGASIYVYNPYDSSSYSFVSAQNSFIVLAGTTLEGYKNIGVLKSAQQCNGIQFYSKSIWS
jgi:hypothetical protein